MKQRPKQILLLALTVVLATSVLLRGCGSLSNTFNEPDPPRENTAVDELTHVIRTGEEYKGIEILHGTWEEPHYSSDKKGYFYEASGWLYLHLEGEPKERGFQHGWLLADSIQQQVDFYTKMLAELDALDWQYLRANAERMWAEKVSVEYAAEIEGMVEGVNERGGSVDYVDLLTLNGLEELRTCWFPTVQDNYYQELAAGLWNPVIEDSEQEALMSKVTGVLPSETPNAVASSTKLLEQTGRYQKQASVVLATGSATESGKIILAQNTLASYADSNFSNVIIDLVPAEGQRFTMQAAPGYIHSVGEAYSTKHLLIANTRINGFKAYNEQGIPEFLRIRHAAQYADSLDSFISYMTTDLNGGLASNWLVGDLSTNEIMQFELGLSFYRVEKTTDGSFISFNGVSDARISSFETERKDHSDIRSSSGSRSVRLAELMAIYDEKLTTDAAQTIVSDHHDAYQNKTYAGSRSICAHGDVEETAYTADAKEQPYAPYGTVDAKIMSTELAQENTMMARWGSACGRAFDSQAYLDKHTQYAAMQDFLFDRAAQSWNWFYPRE